MLIFKSILLLVFCKVLYVNGNIQCKQPNNKCVCMPIRNGYKYQCPNEKTPNVIITVQQKMINIQCIGAVNWTNQDFTFIETHNINQIVIRDCWFATNNFDKITNIFGINSTELLKINMAVGLRNFTLTTDYFYGVYNLKTLTLQDSSINDVSEDGFKSLTNLIELNIENNNIFLDNDMFKYLQKLKVLKLNNNNLVSLPSDLLQNLNELEILHLWYNNFTTLDNNTFCHLRKLELLDLSGNQLNSLPSDIFYELRNLKRINLSMNKLQSIPTNIFTKNSLLEFANFSDNPDLSSLPKNVFGNLTELQTILLHDCKFSQLSPNLLEESIHLKNIALQRNEIEVIPESLFTNLAELQNIDLSYNKIKYLSKDVFRSLIQLKTLNLESNLLTHIKQEYFKHLRDLELLDLKNNRIRLIDPQAFHGMGNLKKIVLSNNCLNSSMGSILNYNTKLENIDLSNNNITEMDNDFVIKVGLRELDLSYNQISYIEFSNLMTVSFPIKINLNYNNISTINFDFAEAITRSQGDYYENLPENLARNVYLDGNPIICDCSLYNVLRYFDHSIDPVVPNALKIIAGNLTCASPNEFRKFLITQLKPSMILCTLPQLGIKDNYCPKQCICKYRPYDKTLVVNCIQANLTEVPRLNISARHFDQLEVHLQRNFLTSGPKEHMGYENVTKLFLDYNNISDLSWVPPKIKVLQLNNNNIQYINDNVLTMLNQSSVTNLTLGNNPIVCDCSVKELRTYVISHLLSKQVQLDFDDITCKNSDQFLAFNNDYCPPYKDILIGFSVPICLAIFTIAVLIILWSRRKNNSFKHTAIIVSN